MSNLNIIITTILNSSQVKNEKNIVIVSTIIVPSILYFIGCFVCAASHTKIHSNGVASQCMVLILISFLFLRLFPLLPHLYLSNIYF